MRNSIPKPKVILTMTCLKCGEVILSNEEEAALHVIGKHGVDGDLQSRFYVYNVARLYFEGQYQMKPHRFERRSK